MKKIIQIQADHGDLYALTEDGKVYIKENFSYETDTDGKKYEGIRWAEIKEFRKEMDKKDTDLPF